METVVWLEDWLKRYDGTLILISHDRDFLDQVVDSVIHIEHRSLTSYTGGYSDFEAARAQHLANQQAQFEKQPAPGGPHAEVHRPASGPRRPRHARPRVASRRSSEWRKWPLPMWIRHSISNFPSRPEPTIHY